MDEFRSQEGVSPDVGNNRALALALLPKDGVRWLSGEGVWLVIRRLPDRFPTVPNYVVSLGKALHPTCLGGNVPLLTVSRSG